MAEAGNGVKAYPQQLLSDFIFPLKDIWFHKRLSLINASLVWAAD